jgi:hypothetical protein
MRTSGEYDRVLTVVRKVIHEWDPYLLIGNGAPLNEFDQEIAQLTAQASRIHSASDAAKAISRIFTSAFHAEGFSETDCAEVGKNLYSQLVALGFLQGEA